MKKIILLAIVFAVAGLWGGVGHSAGVNPDSLEYSGVWYAQGLRKNFPTVLRACGVETKVEDFSLLPRDITKFRLYSTKKANGMLLALFIDGSVGIGAIPQPFAAPKSGYTVYIDAFLFGPDGRVYDVQSTTGATLAASGGKSRFQLVIGEGYDFSSGGRVLVVASGEPLSSTHLKGSCALLGAKWLSIK